MKPILLVLFRYLRLLLIVAGYFYLGVVLSSWTNKWLHEIILINSPLQRYYHISALDGSRLKGFGVETEQYIQVSLAEFKATSEPDSVFATIEKTKVILSVFFIISFPIIGFFTSRKSLHPPQAT